VQFRNARVRSFTYNEFEVGNPEERIMQARTALIGCALGLACCAGAHADSELERHWIGRIGVHPVNPKPDNHSAYQVDGAGGISVGSTYLLDKHWGVEVFAAFPPAHELHALDGERVGRFRMLPSSATVQYHLSDSAGHFRAYAGIGVAYAAFDAERTKGRLGASTMRLDDSTGIAAALGLDVNLDSKWFVNVDARWMDIDADLTLDGAGAGKLRIDPYLFGVSVGRRLR
jgi:outer membrane protein